MTDMQVCERCHVEKEEHHFIKAARRGLKTECLTCQDCRDKAKKYRQMNGCCVKPSEIETYPRKCKRCEVPKQKEEFQVVGKPYIYRMCNLCRDKHRIYNNLVREPKPRAIVVEHARPEQNKMNDILKGKW